jgi:hypothetical protein
MRNLAIDKTFELIYTLPGEWKPRHPAYRMMAAHSCCFTDFHGSV